MAKASHMTKTKIKRPRGKKLHSASSARALQNLILQNAILDTGTETRGVIEWAQQFHLLQGASRENVHEQRMYKEIN